ncbi:MAG: proline dehydrogenase family protein [Acidobacteria bacterium]|nr:proline dehydrogenase family protein [Acidobacteriota bacterium]MDW7984474.1 proline dehydrogenase family protein [Acidobacteriota bacterium]
MQDWVVRLPVSRQWVRRFVAGERLEEALRVVATLQRSGAKAALDFLGENVHSAEEARQAQQAYRVALDEIYRLGLDCNISVKLTQMGLALSPELCLELVRPVVAQAQAYGTDVEVDMESSAYTDATLAIVHRLRDEFERVGVAIQAYLYRSESDVWALIQRGIKVRLVKGAYREPPRVAFPTKRQVNENFVHLMEILFDSGQYHAIATHDARLIARALDDARRRGLSPRAFEFQMLYGIRRDLQERLVREGWTLRVYVPYGTHWYPYFMRRLAERPANVLFLLRHIAR